AQRLARHAAKLLGAWPASAARRKDEALRGLTVLQAKGGRPDLAAKTFARIEAPFHRAAAAAYAASALVP
ncbi:MAG: hypothetical protein ACC662_10975, partial [Planctomycetota bacterium]